MQIKEADSDQENQSPSNKPLMRNKSSPILKERKNSLNSGISQSMSSKGSDTNFSNIKSNDQKFIKIVIDQFN